jgi:methylmalonyl-CoA mutase
VAEIVESAIQEDVDAIAVSSYQGGHMEFFSYMLERLWSHGAEHVAVFGGGGGVITPREIEELHQRGVDRIYSPRDGQDMGLDGMIAHMMKRTRERNQVGRGWNKPSSGILQFSRQLTAWLSESAPPSALHACSIPILGFTGTGGAGKSSLIDEMVLRYRLDFPDHRILIVSCDPIKKKTQGALLGDRIRMNAIYGDTVFLRSIATSEEFKALHPGLYGVYANVTGHSFFQPDLILVETSGIGQADTELTQYVHKSVYVMTSEFGAESQLEKISMLDYADLIVVNKMDRQGSEDAIHQVRKTYRRFRDSHEMSKRRVVGACASRFQDAYTHQVYARWLELVNEVRTQQGQTLLKTRYYGSYLDTEVLPEIRPLIPRHRTQYLAEISESVRGYHKRSKQIANQLKHLECLEELAVQSKDPKLELLRDELRARIPQDVFLALETFKTLSHDLKSPELVYHVRGKPIRQQTRTQTLSGLSIPRVAPAITYGMADTYLFCANENYPGFFPFTAGVFPFRRSDELPKRMFAGEGGPARTNQRFHYLCRHEKAKRLSTAFDSATLYGADPDERPDIFGKIGESGVSIATLEDMKDLYAGFDLCDPSTSVSMTINGPAPMILAFFFNTAIDQQVGLFEKNRGSPPSVKEREEIFKRTLSAVRGTVQADILKEDQAQNTCIFSTEFALRMMADIQAYFVEHKIQNFYSVSISGYHIAEAGAAPISQLAFTLANGFTYVELYRARGLEVNHFAPNLSFFFSNGLDAEYTVMGRVARRIWAIAMRDHYRASERSQKLKYHVQTSGRSLHAQEIQFNDIRTTLQALIALMDNCNSLHTNAYDEAITTPTAESVRRAMATQLITAQEMGLMKNENPLQGSYFMTGLTDQVEEAVLKEFDRISDRGGVLQAMEFQYQRDKIQTESFTYEQLKHDGTLPIIGVNTYLPEIGDQPKIEAVPLTRCTYEEKNDQLRRLREFQKRHVSLAGEAKEQLRHAALNPDTNLFAVLMEVSRVLSLGQMSDVLFECGGKYRRNL